MGGHREEWVIAWSTAANQPWKALVARDGLPADEVSSLVLDAKGRLWMTFPQRPPAYAVPKELAARMQAQ